MAIEFLGVTQQTLTREVAQNFANMDHWAGERRLRNERLAYLDSELRADRFYSPKWAVVTCKGKSYRVNGQHSSTMLSRANGHFPDRLPVTIDQWKCDEEWEVGDIFTRYDDPRSVRGTGEQMGALFGDLFSSNEKARLVRITSGMLAVQRTFTKRSWQARERHDIINGFPGFAHFALNSSIPVAWRRPPVFGAMLKTWQASSEAATDFWNMTATGSGTHPTHPTRTLEKYLREVRQTTDVGTSREICAKCIFAWNAYRRGVDISKLQYRQGDEMPTAI